MSLASDLGKLYFCHQNNLKMKKSTKHIKFRKTILWIIGISVFLSVLLVVISNSMVKKSAEGRMYQNASEIPYRRVGIVLGTTPARPNGNPNLYYQYRMEAAAELYSAGKISYIIVSGDNHKHEYNEPECMRRSLVALGVPDSVIYPDYAGFRTFDSMVRCKKVFGQDSVTVISQGWHNERALYIAENAGLDAIAFNAGNTKSRKWKFRMKCREILARVKAVFETL